jgi:hypothetical protein
MWWDMGSSAMIKGLGLVLLTAVSVVCWPPEGRAFDPDQATDELAQYLREDIQRQRARAQREEAEAVARGADLSEFGDPVEPTERVTPRRSRRSIQCTTINLGGGDFATDCD